MDFCIFVRIEEKRIKLSILVYCLWDFHQTIFKLKLDMKSRYIYFYIDMHTLTIFILVDGPWKSHFYIHFFYKICFIIYLFSFHMDIHKNIQSNLVAIPPYCSVSFLYFFHKKRRRGKNVGRKELNRKKFNNSINIRSWRRWVEESGMEYEEDMYETVQEQYPERISNKNKLQYQLDYEEHT